MSITNPPSPSSDNDPFEVVSNEPIQPFVLTYHWLLLFPISAGARDVYQLLVAHINQERGDAKVWPSKASLAAMLRYKKPDSLDKFFEELYDTGLVSVTHSRTDRGMKTRNVYVVRTSCPQGYKGPRSVSQWHVDNSKKNGKSPGDHVPLNQGVRTPQTGVSVPPKQGVELKEFELKEKSPPPTSSKNGSVDNSAKARIVEEEFPQNLKNFVLNLDYHGQTPSREELVRVARAAKRLWGQVEPADLKRRLQHNAGINAHSLVAVYVKRLSSYTVADFNEQPKAASIRKSQPRWCGMTDATDYRCDGATRRLYDEDGFLTQQWCPKCSGRVPEPQFVGSSTT